LKLCLFTLLLCLGSIHAAQPPSFSPKYTWELSISTQDGALPAESVVYVRYFGDDGKTYSTLLSLREDGKTTLYTNSGIQSAEMSYDDNSTPALDPIWNGSLEAAVQPVLVRLQPVGDVAGVLALQNGSAAAFALVELSCSDGVARNTTTGATGAFSFSQVRAGRCVASASVDGQVVREEFSLGMGEFRSLEIRAKKTDAEFYAAAAGALGLGAIIIWLFAGKKPKPSQSAPEAGASRQIKKVKVEKMPTQRQLDLLATLNGKEKGIVQYVIHHFPAAVRVSRIRRDLLVPKTSLTRTLQALERKRFLKIEKLGARQFVRLDDFFKGDGIT